MKFSIFSLKSSNKQSILKALARRQAGFTLIELIVVITIIGILSTVLVANFMQVRYKTRDSVRKSDLEQIRLALETYRVDMGEYPTSLYASGCTSSLSNSSGTVYMAQIPCDPRDGDQYHYVRESALRYNLFACAENENDQDAVDETTTSACSGGNWNGKIFMYTNP